MPEFFVPYFGKIRLSYTVTQDSISQCNLLNEAYGDYSANRVIPALLIYYSILKKNIYMIESITNLTVCLLKLKDYSSCLCIYNQTEIQTQVMSYNIALASIYLKQYKFGLAVLQSCFQDSPEFYLLKGLLLYFLNDDAKSLETFSYCKKINFKDGIDLTKTYKFETAKRYKKWSISKDSTNNLSYSHSSHSIKSSSLMSLSNSTSKQVLKPTKLNFESKNNFLTKKISLKKKTGFNMDSVNWDASPNPISSKLILTELPEIYKSTTPKGFKASYLTNQDINKIITYYTTANKDIESLYKTVKKLKFFKDYSKIIGFKLLSCAEYRHFAQGEVIFYEKEYADSIYIILKGSVSVEKEYSKIPWVINSRYDGEVIGECAMIRGNIDKKEAKRTATCFASESSHLLKINFTKYTETLKERNELEKNILNFLQSLVIFEHISLLDLALISNFVCIKKFTFEKEVLAYDEIPKGLYILYQGRLKALYRKKALELPPKYFFGQRVYVGESTKSKCSVISNAAESLVILIEPHHFQYLYHSLIDSIMSILKNYVNIDL